MKDVCVRVIILIQERIEHPDSTTQASRSYRAETAPDIKRNKPPTGPWPPIDCRQGKLESVHTTHSPGQRLLTSLAY